MRVKAIGDLAQRIDRDLFAEVASGLDLVAKNALALEDDAQHAWQGRRTRLIRRSCSLLGAREESTRRG